MSWDIVRLGDVCETSSGGTPKTSNNEFYDKGTIPWLNSGELKQGVIYNAEKFITQTGLIYSSAKIVPEGSVLVAMYGATAGVVGLLSFSSTINQAICAILPNELFCPYFLYRFLQTQKSEMISKTAGGAQPNISQEIIKALLIPLPPINEQCSIAADIEQQLAVVEKAKQAAMGQLAITQALKASYLREIFEGNEWEQVRLGDVCLEDKEVIDGRISSKPYLGLDMIESETGNIDWTTNTNEGISTCYYFDSRHILYGKLRPYLNKVALPTIEGRCSTEIIPLLPKAGVYREYVAFLLRRKETMDYIMPENTGSRMPRADMKYLFNMKVPRPPIDEQRRIIAEIKRQFVAVDKVTNAAMEQLDTISVMPAAILRQAFSGQM